MKAPLWIACLLAVGCATRGQLPESSRGYATDSTIECATLLLEQRDYAVDYFPKRRELRGVKSFRSGGQHLIVSGIVTARLEPEGSRAVLAVRTERRFANQPQDTRSSRRLLPSAYFAAGAVDEDARTILEQCTTARAPD
ncbi:MAG TPA: hypothetical protein VF613_16790 [Longimicrobium sp.]|jgi:hypothetical protein